MRSAEVTTVMVAAVFLSVGLNTLVKANLSKGMSNYVFVAYSNLFGFCFLLIATTLHYRNRSPTPLNNFILFRIFLIGFLSVSIQTLAYAGLGYSSPTLISAIEDLLPAFTFIIAVVFRMEKLDLKLRSYQAKTIGTVVSIAGALTMTLYKGFAVTSNLMPNNLFLSSQQSQWVLGAFLITTAAFCASVSLVIQTWTINDYPEELMLITIATSFSVILSFVVAFIAEQNPKAWILKPDMELVCILYSAIVVLSTRSVVYAWACRKKGAVYVAMFSPLGIVIALAMGIVFLGDTLYLGSVIGAATIAVGFYAVIWGQAQEENMTCEKDGTCGIICSSSSCSDTLLLHKTKDTMVA
ncbi:WAT1-related protein At5g40240 [Vigna radiata var. radiata]|uniref:WAT1-related protein n=1 Tax=Vigna radiata var. radiata TaxID=3916 RepID=A0A1S3VYQ1_VIGRR|nr:WAT1-related protein At5g40240 [Vigna radiata var. radiata]